MKFDELNQLLTRYYDVMEIPKEDKKKRVDLGLGLFELFLYILLYIKNDIKTDNPETVDDYVKSLDYRIRDVLEEKNLPYDEEYIPKLSQDIVETTLRHPDDKYYFSEDRALIITLNEANTIMNNVDFVSAKKQGKTYKRWITEKDERVRPWHEEVDETKIPIDEMFKVGNDELRFPHDYINGSPENLINCRCSCLYS